MSLQIIEKIENNNKIKNKNIIIDVHHHVAPESFINKYKNMKFIRDSSLPKVDEGALFMDGKMPHATIEEDLDFMDKSGITFAITSITAEESNYHKTIKEEIAYFDECNEYQMKMVNKNPKRFGAFLNFPLSDIDIAINKIYEIKKEYNNNFYGFLLPAEYKTIYLGDNYFIPIYEELNKSETVIFVHPTTKENADGMLSTFSQAVEEFMFQTTRTISTLLVNDIFDRYKNIKWIFPHMGGTFPYIRHRFELYHKYENVFEELWKNKNVYFDSAGSFSEVQWNAGIYNEQILAGSDAPYQNYNYKDKNKWTSELNIDIIRDKENICYKNAFILFPKLKDLFNN